MRNDYIVKQLYISFVVVSILSSLTATTGMLIDNIIVGTYLGETALGAMGIIGPVSLIFSAFGNICSGGGAAQAAQALGKGDSERVNQVFSITMLFVLISGFLLTIAGLLFTPQIASVLGAKGELLEPAVDYLRGYFLGAIPTIMMTALMGFVKIDGSPRLPLLCIIVMTAANIVLDLAMVKIFHLGMYGMALATTISYCLAVLTGFSHFFKKSSTLRLVKAKTVVKELLVIISTGAPTAISRICDTIKVMILNNLLVLFVGTGAVVALNVRTQANSFFGAFILGLAQAAVPMLGMFYGEENKSALHGTLKTTFRIGLFMNGAAAVILFFGAPVFANLMHVEDPSAMGMSVLAVRMFAAGMPLALINYGMMSYYQSTRSTGMATLICVLQSLCYTVLLAVLLVRPLGANGVWITFLGAEVLSIITILIAAVVHTKHFPRDLYDLMRLKPGFGGNEKDRLELSVGNNMEEVTKISMGIRKFGNGRNINERVLTQLALCIEEMGGNIVKYAFKPGEKKWFDVCIIDKKDQLIVQIRDNGAPFDPTRHCMSRDTQQYGIRIIQGIAERMEYRRMIGLNSLIIVLKK